MSIVLTVPHSQCQEKHARSKHTCDYIAAEMGQYLSEKLLLMKYSVSLLMGDNNRIRCDLNRPNRCSENFQNKLVDAIHSGARVHLDVHSYDKRAPWTEFEMCVMTLKSPTPRINRFLSQLRRSQIKLCVIPFDPIVALMPLAHKTGAETVLLEFNESVPAPRLLDVCNHVCNAISSLLT